MKTYTPDSAYQFLAIHYEIRRWNPKKCRWDTVENGIWPTEEIAYDAATGGGYDRTQPMVITRVVDLRYIPAQENNSSKN